MNEYEKATHCYIGTKACGCTVLAVVDAPHMKKLIAKETGQAIREGMTVERVPIADVNLTTCTHGSRSPKAKTPALPLA